MQYLTTILVVSQLLFTIVAGIYFYQSLKSNTGGRGMLSAEAKRKMEALRKMRSISLSEPLSEKTRPQSLEEIKGQEDGVKALRGALCGKNPHHVLIYGPPGIGKTAAARLVLEEAKKQGASPFGEFSKFVEIDATTLRFDERSIADPLIGSVHDPIYQGAGAYGSAGVPQPREGAVSKAHGGVLFIDEIGELHPVQLNKLLKVLEDRKVYFTSSYYSEDNEAIPRFIHEIFKNGMPADFRLVGATTRRPSEIPPALRSRCTEIFFDDLKREHIVEICNNAMNAAGYLQEDGCCEKIADYARNGRDAVNITELAASAAELEKREEITIKDIEWVAEIGRYSVHIPQKIPKEPSIGVVNGLAVSGEGSGLLLPIEVIAKPSLKKGGGSFNVTGIAYEEELKSNTGCLKRKSTAKASMENVLTVIEAITELDTKDYHIHVNFPGGAAVDGPSAGIAVFCAMYSALLGVPMDNKIAMTGEISIRGEVLAVGGVNAKIEAAQQAGAQKVIIPVKNYQKTFDKFTVAVCKAEKAEDVLEMVFGREKISLKKENKQEMGHNKEEVLSAESI